ncbi:hypothetical protein [Streptomyces sp. NPDC096153]|uniref:hypothetical protein n=1 Tax=Streptomyces sp. NPDC096153 TaxID=3155548 RepID=UPI00331E2FAD
MPEIRTVTDVVTDHLGPDRVECWRVRTLTPTGHVHEHIFPTTTLEWRSAEYGIDPEDTETLLDVILHEPFLPDLDDPAAAAEDPAVKAGMTAAGPAARGLAGRGAVVPVRLHNAATIDDARTAHLMRIQAVKDKIHVKAPSGKQSPLKRIHDAGVDRSRVAAFAEVVDEARRQHRRDQLPPEPATVPIDDAAERRLVTIRSQKESARA